MEHLKINTPNTMTHAKKIGHINTNRRRKNQQPKNCKWQDNAFEAIEQHIGQTVLLCQKQDKKPPKTKKTGIRKA